MACYEGIRQFNLWSHIKGISKELSHFLVTEKYLPQYGCACQSRLGHTVLGVAGKRLV